jgi:GNAT superfamily N-acetyltransferase
MSTAEVRIEPVTTRRQLHDLVMFPFRLYRNDPFWVAPLIGERMQHFDPHHNPFFEHARMQMFRATRDGETVGTIAAVADDQHVAVWGEAVGFFGVFECIDDQAVANALLDAARAWLRGQGREVMRGPFNLNINDEIGLLIEGFDGPPVVMMTYNPPYYERLFEGYGLAKAKDVRAYKLDIAAYGPNMENLPQRVSRVAQVAVGRHGVTMRHIDMKRFAEEVELIKPIYRQAWAKNWSAIPMTDHEFDYLAASLKQAVDPELTYLAFYEGRPIGCFLAIPDLCQVAIHMKGRLFPFGWAQYLWHRRHIDGLRVMIMGVLEEHRLKGVEALFYQEACRIAIRKGFKWVEMSWILEDNYKVIRGIEMMGGRSYRVYRVYDKPTA